MPLYFWKIKMSRRHWYTIVNPNARGGEVRKKWEKIEKYLLKEKVSFEAVFTNKTGHAIELVNKAIQNNYKNFLIIGGDGTLNEVVNSIFKQHVIDTREFLLALIPFGSGNDWARIYNLPLQYKDAIKLLKNGKTFTQDIGKATFWDHQKEITRYFINVAGMGFDARVAYRTNKAKDRGKKGAWIYFKNLLLTLLLHRNTFADVEIDDGKEAFKTKTFSMSVGIGNYNGGGMMQLPFARPDDGLLDLTLIGRVTKFEVIKEVKNLYDGSFVNHPKVKVFTGKKIKIDSNPPISIEIDGESLGHSPFTFEIISKSINVIGVELNPPINA